MKQVKATAWIDGPVKYPDEDEFMEEVQDDRFHIGQCYEDEACKTVKCRKCGGDKFHVGKGNHFTAIKCPVCGWELCIHDG